MGRLRRLPEYDYSQAGYYFLTVCTKGRACILSTVGRGILDAPPLSFASPGKPVAGATAKNVPLAHFLHAIGRGILDAPPPQLTEYGIRVESALHYLDTHMSGVTIDKHVIMPNHLHLIVVLNNASLGASGMPRPTNSGMTRPANSVIPKLVSSLKRFTNRSCGTTLWQSGYHDHVIRNEADYLRIWQYIDTNPAIWTEDRYYSR